WNPSRGRACTIDHFTPDFQSSTNSPFNESVAKVFVEHIMTSDIPEAASASEKDILDLYLARFRSVRKQQRLDLDPAEYERRLQMNRRRERKKWLYYRRVEAAESFEDTKHLVPVLQALGVDGMSTDESDHGRAGHTQYRVRHKVWRSPAADGCFKTLDALHRHRRFRPVRRATGGAQVHQRLSSNLLSDRPPVPYLPSSAY
ncbi:hypothetical protein FA13DRAFT_1585501, partial [Coprinellus micaceus]